MLRAVPGLRAAVRAGVPTAPCPALLSLQSPLKQQAVFDYIDVSSGIGGEIAPGSYRLATAFPRRVLEDGAAAQTLAQLELTTRQEALFLEPK